jgi:LPS-assembly protein
MLALASSCLHAQQASSPGVALRPSPMLTPPPRGEGAKRLPIIVQADKISGRPDLETLLEGNADFRQGGLVVDADLLSYDHPEDLAIARGHVRVTRDGNTYTGSELQLRVQRFEGYVQKPTYHFGRLGAGGSADRIDFIDDQRSIATNATYTSCLPDGSGAPAWLLTTDKVKLDLETNEGVAQGAVLRFLGVPILGAPVLSFPLTDQRKSGWLPPTIVPVDSRGGPRIAVPYYWNIAPNRDATITPGISTKRGPSLDTEFRYLDPRNTGLVDLNLLPHDDTTGNTRYSLHWQNDTLMLGDASFRARVDRVSDDTYWKDFARPTFTLTPRLLIGDMQLSKPFGDWTTYARVERWQVLQHTDSDIDAPYERLPQIGARTLKRFGAGFQVSFESEFNRFVNPEGTIDTARVTGDRLHLLGSVSRPFVTPGWSLTPKIAFNAASYSLDQPMSDGRRSASRVIPTFSLDSAWTFERDARWFGRNVRQTLEPRILYVNTPYRDQSKLPNFDSAAKDFNFESIYSGNQFSGVDRVADAHQVTAGVITRFIDPTSGGETLRLGAVQRYLIRDQRVTPEGPPLTQHISDVLLLASTKLVPNWSLDSTVEYNPDIKRTARSVIGVRYSPGPFRTINATYRMTRDLSEQAELGWQWPLYGQTPDQRRENPRAQSGMSCGGSLYAVGRFNYSLRDSRMTDSVVGFEYDAGCWIGRIVAERLSTGRSEATTHVLLQLELVGLSRLGSNTLQVLKDNIPGYRLLRDSSTLPAATNPYD